MQGENLKHATIQRSVNCTAACWQAQKKILALGWETGEVVIWNEAERELNEVPKLHKSSVCCLEWSAKSSRLVSADMVCTHGSHCIMVYVLSLCREISVSSC